jgi:hypothetical protein
VDKARVGRERRAGAAWRGAVAQDRAGGGGQSEGKRGAAGGARLAAAGKRRGHLAGWPVWA